MIRAVAGVALAMLLVVAGCDEIGIPAGSGGQPSGIEGLVKLGPTCAVETTPGANDPVPCVTPYSAQLVVLDGESSVVARVTSAADGTFRVDVAPGEYVVAPVTGADSYPIANPVSVTVAAGQYARIEINYDTGIR